VGEGEWQLPQISASASEKDGVLTVTLANLSADAPAEVAIGGVTVKSARGRVLSGEMHMFNDFDASPLTTRELAVAVDGGAAKVTLPACAVAEISLTC